jgi:isopenicillin N synthase-like dioxygenase
MGLLIQDSNCITFIFQDDVGGLEVLTDGHWVPAEPACGSIIVNIGDVIQVKPESRISNSTQIRNGPVTKISLFFFLQMQVLSNNKLKSARHRVVRKPAHRHSFAFFFNLHGDKWVEPLPEFTAKIGEAPRYRGFLYREYQQLRVRNKTHPPARPEDVVNITHYAI